MLNRWLKGQQEEGGSGLKRRRPYMASACKDLNECDKWRQILRDIGAKVMEIQNSALQEDRIRELNDEINKLMRVKHAWEKQILKLGGPNYIKQASAAGRGEGIPGGESPGRLMPVPHPPRGEHSCFPLTHGPAGPTDPMSRLSLAAY